MYALTEPMGDSIIAPLYRHLLKWGVKFEFFCRVKSVNLSPTEALVDKVVLAQQVRLNKGLQRYEPLISRADGHDSWPLHPLVEQIDHGEDLDGYDLEFGLDGLAGRDPRARSQAAAGRRGERERGRFRFGRARHGIWRAGRHLP